MDKLICAYIQLFTQHMELIILLRSSEDDSPVLHVGKIQVTW